MAPRLRVVEAAQQLRERRLARAVLADDRERGTGRDREVETVEHRAGRRRRTRRRGRACGSRARAVPAGAAIAGGERADRCHRRPRAAAPRPTGCAAPSSAQLRPPNAIELVPTALVANTTSARGVMLPDAAASASDQNTSAVRRRARAAGSTAPVARAVESHATAARKPAAAVREPLDGPVREAEQPDLLRRRRVDREPVRVLGVPLRLRTSSVLRSRHTELSRSSQCVATHAPPSTRGAHQR